jgi:tetrahydromethanopterin S-methyltransferase subunit G
VAATEQERLARVEGILEEMRSRLNSLEQRIEQRFTVIEQRLTSIENRFNLLFGVIVTMWVTIIVAILLRT